MKEKIIPRQTLQIEKIEEAFPPTSDIIFTSGAFDLVHLGHIKFLEKAKRISPSEDLPLVVAVNSDESVRKYKPHKIVSRPILSEESRLFTIAALECVDYAFLFDEPTNIVNLYTLYPRYFVKGGYNKDSLDPGEVKIATCLGTEIVLIDMIGSYSTTSIVERILEDGAGTV